MKKLLRGVIVIGFLFLVNVTCSKDKDNDWKGKVKIRNKVSFIENPTNGLWRSAKKLKVEKILSIGESEGDDRYILAEPMDVDVDQNKNIYICDWTDNCIKVYDKDGNFLNRIGQQGQGPGELFWPKYITLSSKNLLYVACMGNKRISIFNMNTDFVIL